MSIFLINPYILIAPEITSSYGWSAGGIGNGLNSKSTVSRVEFASETYTPSVRGPLNVNRSYHSSSGNSFNGWAACGSTQSDVSSAVGTTTSAKIIYSNDTVTASSSGNMSYPRLQPMSSGNNTHGWWSGGYAPRTTPNAETSRKTWASDTDVGLDRGALTIPRGGGEAVTDTENYGWYGGGATRLPGTGTPTRYSTVDRLDYSNDTAEMIVRGPLSNSPDSPATTWSEDYGWWYGGGVPAAGSSINRIEYANDTATALRRANLPDNVEQSFSHGITDLTTYGWILGSTSSIRSDGYRLIYASDTTTPDIYDMLPNPAYSGSSSSGAL